jgi:hypothetical protein
MQMTIVQTAAGPARIFVIESIALGDLSSLECAVIAISHQARLVADAD